jgi:hypothetical protein
MQTSLRLSRVRTRTLTLALIVAAAACGRPNVHGVVPSPPALLAESVGLPKATAKAPRAPSAASLFSLLRQQFRVNKRGDAAQLGSSQTEAPTQSVLTESVAAGFDESDEGLIPHFEDHPGFEVPRSSRVILPRTAVEALSLKDEPRRRMSLFGSKRRAIRP